MWVKLCDWKDAELEADIAIGRADDVALVRWSDVGQPGQGTWHMRHACNLSFCSRQRRRTVQTYVDDAAARHLAGVSALGAVVMAAAGALPARLALVCWYCRGGTRGLARVCGSGVCAAFLSPANAGPADAASVRGLLATRSSYSALQPSGRALVYGHVRIQAVLLLLLWLLRQRWCGGPSPRGGVCVHLAGPLPLAFGPRRLSGLLVTLHGIVLLRRAGSEGCGNVRRCSRGLGACCGQGPAAEPRHRNANDRPSLPEYGLLMAVFQLLVHVGVAVLGGYELFALLESSHVVLRIQQVLHLDHGVALAEGIQAGLLAKHGILAPKCLTMP